MIRRVMMSNRHLGIWTVAVEMEDGTIGQGMGVTWLTACLCAVWCSMDVV